MTEKELEEINAFRQKEGMRPLQRKERKCLKCEVKFMSIDTRMCNRCSIRNKTSYQNADESRYAVNYINGKR